MSWSQVIVFVVLGTLLGAHPKVAPIVGPVTSAILAGGWYLTTHAWAWIVSHIRRKPKEEKPAVASEVPTSAIPEAS
jgi:O-antigen/teichoic acid export membrane protein